MYNIQKSEANSNGQFIGLNECTGLNVADFIIEHCIYRANHSK